MKQKTKLLSKYVQEALNLMANYIKSTRIEKKITTRELAERANISRSLLHRIENADPNCAIGTVFEVAAILKIQLFNADHPTLMIHNKIVNDKLSLLPNTARKPNIKLDDDF